MVQKARATAETLVRDDNALARANEKGWLVRRVTLTGSLPFRVPEIDLRRVELQGPRR